MQDIEEVAFEWNEIPVKATLVHNWPMEDMAHIEVKAGERLPITETGYRSIYSTLERINEFEGLGPFLRSLFDETAKEKLWQQYWEDRKQLSLF